MKELQLTGVYNTWETALKQRGDSHSHSLYITSNEYYNIKYITEN